MRCRDLIRFSFLVSVVLLVSVSSRAQTFEAYNAEIPFDFTIGNDTYNSGEYVIRLRMIHPHIRSVSRLTVESENGGEIQSVMVRKNGDISKTNQATMLFRRYGDHYLLERITSPRFGFSAPKSKAIVKVWVEGDPEPDGDTVSIVLKP